MISKPLARTQDGWMSKEDRAVGSLLGLAVGDAVGTTLEFERPGTFEPISDMVGGGPFRLPAGAWTDDTSMALCLAESIVDTGGMDLTDQLRRYVAWRRDGYLLVHRPVLRHRQHDRRASCPASSAPANPSIPTRTRARGGERLADAPRTGADPLAHRPRRCCRPIARVEPHDPSPPTGPSTPAACSAR